MELKISWKGISREGAWTWISCSFPMYLSHYYCCSQNTLYNEQLFNIQFHLMERKWRKVKSRKKEGKTCLISCSPLWACIESEVRESVGHGWLLFYLHPPVDFSVIYGMLSCFFVNCIAAPFPFYVSLVAPTKAESLGFKSHHLKQLYGTASPEKSYCTFFGSACNCIHPSCVSEMIVVSKGLAF